MVEFHQLIIEELKKFRPEVSRLGVEALKLAEDLPEISVTEQLKNIVRQIVREGKVVNDSK